MYANNSTVVELGTYHLELQVFCCSVFKKTSCVYKEKFLIGFTGLFYPVCCSLGHPLSLSSTPNPMREQGSFSSPLMSQVSTRKRRSSEVVIEPSSAAKKTRSKTTFTKFTDKGSFPL